MLINKYKPGKKRMSYCVPRLQTALIIICIVLSFGILESRSTTLASGTLIVGVYDVNTQPVAGATVAVELSGNVIRQATTLANGEVTFSLSAGLNYDVKASKGGFSPAIRQHVNIIDGVTTRLTMILRQCPLTSSLQHYLEQITKPDVSDFFLLFWKKYLFLNTLKDVRNFRDQVLSKSSEGQDIIQIYYDNSEEITRIMQKKPLLLKATVALILNTLSEIRSASVNGGALTVDRQAYLLGTVILHVFESEGSQELKQAIKVARQFIETRSQSNEVEFVTINIE
ncbi:hypothetical protein SCALIN_C22_0105 [Candidatus Scalindua japonica]|uniref:Carboxypeptidase regulatory-like domain-containing protein n=1 Tax=Candidatus Scalindua japonica TaxID=1284222 RepID=A0A286TZS3_9BACT|nr:hypothetical protein SCALIN_C22_0105 [Candidatus Scalindua japonica]